MVIAGRGNLPAESRIVETLTTNEVNLAENGNDALSRGRTAKYAVTAVDRVLPDIDGIAIMQTLRVEGIVTPALIISALGEVDDRVRGLRAGGDDYLVKPFAFAELLARLEALVRRNATIGPAAHPCPQNLSSVLGAQRKSVDDHHLLRMTRCGNCILSHATARATQRTRHWTSYLMGA